jgi:hypothetical protein
LRAEEDQAVFSRRPVMNRRGGSENRPMAMRTAQRRPELFRLNGLMRYDRSNGRGSSHSVFI